jgi:Uma2 family endonuclease
MPDVSWISNARASLDTNDDESFIKVVPDFIAEMRSGSDLLPTL